MDIIGVAAAVGKFYTFVRQENGFCTSWSRLENPPCTITYSIKKRLYAKARGPRRKLQGIRHNKYGLGDHQQNCPFQLLQASQRGSLPVTSSSGIVETV